MINVDSNSKKNLPTLDADLEAYNAFFAQDCGRMDRLIKNAKTNFALHANDYQSSQIYQLELQRLKELRELLREPFENDLKYRQHLLADFVNYINTFYCDPNLRFHSTTLAGTKKIISSRSISSAVDHDGVQNSLDIEGFFSVASPESVGISVKDYLNLQTKSLPIGCMFVLYPQKDEIVSSLRTMSMKNIALREGNTISSQFICVLCAPESIDLVRKWLDFHGFPEDLAVDFFELDRYLEHSFYPATSTFQRNKY